MRDGVEHNHRKWGGEARLGYGHIRGVPARAGPERGAHDKHKRWQRFKHQHQSMDEAYHSMIRAGQLRDGEKKDSGPSLTRVGSDKDGPAGAPQSFRELSERRRVYKQGQVFWRVQVNKGAWVRRRVALGSRP